MATKSSLISTINGYITSIVTVLKTRNAFSSVVDEIYPNQVTDTSDDETYTTKDGTDIEYEVFILKSGSVSMLRGNITNVSGSSLSTSDIFAWKDNEFKPKTIAGNGGKISFKAFGSSTDIVLQLSSSGLSIVSGVLPNGATYEFEYKPYLTQD